MERTVKPRQYDTSNRRRQAAETRRRILDAAHVLFVRDGYTTTTMTAIAAEAGVAIQTVYASAKTKRDIFQAILDVAVSGHDEPVAVIASKAWNAIENEPDAEEKVRLFAELHRQICEREAVLVGVMSEASDPEIRALLHHNAERRYQDQHHLAAHLADSGALAPEHSVTRAADIIWTLASEHTFLNLVRDRGWPARDYEQWLAAQLNAAILRPPTSRSST